MVSGFTPFGTAWPPQVGTGLPTFWTKPIESDGGKPLLSPLGFQPTPLRSWPGAVGCRSNVVVCRSHSSRCCRSREEKIRFPDHFFWEAQKTPVVTPKSFNQLLVETAESANLAHGDKMNVVQIRYGLVGPNTAWWIIRSVKLQKILNSGSPGRKNLLLDAPKV